MNTKLLIITILALMGFSLFFTFASTVPNDLIKFWYNVIAFGFLLLANKSFNDSIEIK